MPDTDVGRRRSVMSFAINFLMDTMYFLSSQYVVAVYMVSTPSPIAALSLPVTRELYCAVVFLLALAYAKVLGWRSATRPIQVFIVAIFTSGLASSWAGFPMPQVAGSMMCAFAGVSLSYVVEKRTTESSVSSVYVIYLSLVDGLHFASMGWMISLCVGVLLSPAWGYASVGMLTIFITLGNWKSMRQMNAHPPLLALLIDALCVAMSAGILTFLIARDVAICGYVTLAVFAVKCSLSVAWLLRTDNIGEEPSSVSD